MDSAEFFESEGKRDPDPLINDLKGMVRNHAHAHPRHAQVALGPSQVGHPCARNVVTGLSVKVKGHSVNPDFDPLPSYIGVASHRAMEDAAHLDNERRALAGLDARWIPEHKVQVADGLSGTCDLYDIETETVIDYKFPGTTKMAQYRKHGPSVLYRVQAHLYGRGYLNEGRPVKRVGIWFLPRSGLLSTSLLWMEDFSNQIVHDNIRRFLSLITLVEQMELTEHPERLKLIPTTPYECQWCPWFSANRKHPSPYACPGGEEYRPQITQHSGMKPV